ncbi:MAG: hypothetical protein AAB774_00200 [Patescibacteria group bacterium]
MTGICTFKINFVIAGGVKNRLKKGDWEQTKWAVRLMVDRRHAQDLDLDGCLSPEEIGNRLDQIAIEYGRRCQEPVTYPIDHRRMRLKLVNLAREAKEHAYDQAVKFLVEPKIGVRALDL